MNINIPFLWAAFVLVTSETTAKAADSFSENFQNTMVTPYLVAPTRYVFGINATPFGTAQDAVFGTFRDYITTAASDYNTVDFVMEITVSVHGPRPSQTAFVGLGSAIPDPKYFTEPCNQSATFAHRCVNASEQAHVRAPRIRDQQRCAVQANIISTVALYE